MNTERWIGSLVNLPISSMFWYVWKYFILALSHSQEFFTDCSTSIINCDKRV